MSERPSTGDALITLALIAGVLALYALLLVAHGFRLI